MNEWRTSNPNYAFSTAGGRYVVLCFHISAADPMGRALLQSVQRNRDLFDDDRMCLFGVSMDPDDARERRVAESLPGIRFFWDFDGKICKEFGAIPKDPVRGERIQALRFWLVLDPT